MVVEILGKFFDNHSLTIINRNIALALKDKVDLMITPMDAPDPQFGVDKEVIKQLLEMANQDKDHADVQIRHTYPPIWQWPSHPKTKVIFIQPWEYPKVPFEWQYKFETFADHLIVPSNYIKDVFTRGGLNPEEVSVVPNGFDDKIFNKKEAPKTIYNIDPDKFNFVYVGNSQWRKGLDLLINAWHRSFKSFDNARLIIKDNPSIYGKNNVINEVIKMQYKTNCAPVTYIDDNLSNEDMANLYKASKVVIHPYRAEGCGMHIQEAVACGCLPIVPDKGPHNDLIPEDVGVRIPTRNQTIDITSNSVFAQKPGDAFSLMSTHTFMNEPDGQSLENLLKYVYASHDKNKYFDKVNELKLENTWEKVAQDYAKVINDVGNRKDKPTRFR